VDDRFVTLASLVASAPAPQAAPAAERAIEPQPVTKTQRPMLDLARADLAQELALMRLAALEAFERATADVLAALAHDVLGRELAIAPADLGALAARALAQFAEHEPVALVVAPGDAGAFETSLPIRVDASLETGDLLIEVRDGHFESRFALRIREAVANVAASAIR
jgi:hypothetical protein